MRFEEKLRKQMLLKGYNQQKLAKLSNVSDSEISRILSGKSGNPGIENAVKLARAVGLSLDYLADDDLDREPEPSEGIGQAASGVTLDPTELDILASAHELGVRQARRILETVCELGFEIAIRRLLEMKPMIEVGDSPRATAALVTSERRASSA
jgi:transcriptional regulator with XRE-family HTH domain